MAKLSTTDFALLLSDKEPDQICIADDRNDVGLSYRQFNHRVTEWHENLADPKGLVFLYLENSIESVAALLGSIMADHAVVLLDPSLPSASREQLNYLYQPERIISSDNGYDMTVSLQPQNERIHPDLSILLSTSGSTGSPKFVRLTSNNVLANATAIAQSLQIGSKDVACAHLPLHYSFGLSVLTSHLVAGAAVRLTKSGFTDRSFWNGMKQAGVTHLPGVPFHFQMLERLRYERIDLPALRSMAQAGGFLDIKGRTKAHDYMAKRNGRFYVMYGQTEAAPRISTLTHEDFTQAPQSVGQALVGGKLLILDDDANPVDLGEEGLVEYHGPNVMMGYAQNRADLLRGDELEGILRTGDIGRMDSAGRLTLTGRAKRSAKIYGLRVNLDEVEVLANVGANTFAADVAVTQRAETLIIHYQCSDGSNDSAIIEKIRHLLAAHYTLPKSCYKFEVVKDIPRTSRGKIDYRQLEQVI